MSSVSNVFNIITGITSGVINAINIVFPFVSPISNTVGSVINGITGVVQGIIGLFIPSGAPAPAVAKFADVALFAADDLAAADAEVVEIVGDVEFDAAF